MAVEEKSNVNKAIYKIVLYLIRIIPIVTSLLVLLNTILSYFYIDLDVFSHLCGISLFTLLFFYATSILFKFCRYHRMFIHYLSLTWLLRVYDYYIGIPISNKSLLVMYLIITGIFLFIILYEYERTIRRAADKDSQ